jgi:SPP1 gp7 family putative phage head morphogenesis protein
MKKAWTALDAKLQKYIQVLAEGRPDSKTISAISQIVTNTQKEMFEFWKTAASTEMGVSVPKTKDEVKWAMRKQNDKIIATMINDIWKKFKKAGYEFSQNGIISQFFNGLKSLFVSWAINLWRQTIFENNQDQIYALQYSAILDDKTTKTCRKLDWLIVKPDSPQVQIYQPPVHWNCRSIWVEILQDEQYKPSFDKNIPDVEIDQPEI